MVLSAPISGRLVALWMRAPFMVLSASTSPPLAFISCFLLSVLHGPYNGSGYPYETTYWQWHQPPSHAAGSAAIRALTPAS